MPAYLKHDESVRGSVTLPIPPTHKKLYQAEEDNEEFIVVIPGNGDGADE
jgi:hypothetical protein